MLDLIKELAIWTGWFPIFLGTIIVMLAGKYLYEQRISHLKDELESGKAYQYDLVYARLSERTKILNQELEIAHSESNTKQEEINRIENDLLSAHSEIRELQSKLRKFDEQLEELVESDDYCDVCDPDEDDSYINFIHWGTSACDIVDNENLIGKVGHCNYCQSPQIKCSVCSCLTSIDLEGDEKVECNGGCGVVFTVSSYIEDKSQQYVIKASLESE